MDVITFGLGGHSCTGRYFAVVEVKYILSQLLLRFKISTPSGKRHPIEDPTSPVRYLLLDCPTESTLDFYIEEFINPNAQAVVRCCQQTYNANRLSEHIIEVIDLPFKDGGMPLVTLVNEWNQLVEKVQQNNTPSDTVKATIAVHCIAGLGHASVLVAIDLIEAGMNQLDAIEFIRNKRRGVFNGPQIVYLDSYKRTTKHTPSSPTWRTSLGKMFRMTT